MKTALDDILVNLALKYCLPHIRRGIAFNRSLQFIIAQVYWQGVLNGYEAAEGEDNGLR